MNWMELAMKAQKLLPHEQTSLVLYLLRRILPQEPEPTPEEKAQLKVKETLESLSDAERALLLASLNGAAS